MALLGFGSPALSRLVPAVGLAFALSGCEIALIVAAAEDDGGDVEGGEFYGYECAEFVDANAGLPGITNRAKLFHTKFDGHMSAPPLSRLATDEAFSFFLKTNVEPTDAFRVEVTGDLTRLDTSVGACATFDSMAASFLEIETAAAGSGSVTVFVDEDEYDRFDFTIAEVAALSIEWDASRDVAMAILSDAEGNDVYSYNGVFWEAAPTAFTGAGMLSPIVGWDGSTNEVMLFAFYGDLQAQLTLVVDPSTGAMVPK